MAFKDAVKISAGEIRGCGVRLREDIPDFAVAGALYEQKKPNAPWDDEPEAIYDRPYTLNLVWYGTTHRDENRHEIDYTIGQAEAEKIHAYLLNR